MIKIGLINPMRKAVAAGVEVFRTRAAWRHALENSYGDVVRNVKG